MFIVFAPIRIEFCRGKLKYDTEHANETFEWEHVLRTTTAKPISIESKNETTSLPKRGIIVPNTRRKKTHKRKTRKSKKIEAKQSTRTSDLFHDSYPFYKKLAQPFDG